MENYKTLSLGCIVTFRITVTVILWHDKIAMCSGCIWFGRTLKLSYPQLFRYSPIRNDTQTSGYLAWLGN